MSFGDAARALSIATAFLIRECRQVLDVNRAAVIAVHGIVEGCKTAPLRFEVGEGNNGVAPKYK